MNSLLHEEGEGNERWGEGLGGRERGEGRGREGGDQGESGKEKRMKYKKKKAYLVAAFSPPLSLSIKRMQS